MSFPATPSSPSPESSASPSTPVSDSPTPSVLVVGAGIAGLACARALQERGVPVRVADRGRRPGGRMSGRTLHGRPVDLGAAYFTAPEGPGAGSGFAAVVADWVARGLVREWTDTLSVLEPGAPSRLTRGPMRYAAPAGLRSLVVDLAERAGGAGSVAGTAGLELSLETAVTAVSALDAQALVELESAEGAPERYDTVVLALPDPQAARLLAPDSSLAARLDRGSWEPTISIALGFEERFWPADLHAAFVNGSPVIDLVADDGDRRGDGAPVLVAHSTAELARAHLDAPDGAVEPVLAEVLSLLGADAGLRPVWTHAHRWTFARPGRQHPEPYLLDGPLAVCGDAWGERSSVGTAWASGDALGRAIAARA